jgi:hypothetical protein
MTAGTIQEMSTTSRQKNEPNQPVIYRIRLKGHLDDQWADWFGGLTITLEENGNTVLTGPVVDQAALFGLLKKVRDLGLPLVSIDCVEPGKEDEPKTRL